MSWIPRRGGLSKFNKRGNDGDGSPDSVDGRIRPPYRSIVHQLIPGNSSKLDPYQSAWGIKASPMALGTRESLRLDMSSLDIAASPPIRRDKTVQISLLLAFACGYLDSSTWIVHGVIANAQTANLVLLRVHGTVGEWDRAVQFVPLIAAFMVGILAYCSVLITGNLRQAIEGMFAVVSGQLGSLRRSGIFAALCVAFGIGAAVGAYGMKVVPDLALRLPVVALVIVLFRRETRSNEERP